MPRNLFLMFIGLAACFFAGKAIGYGITTLHGALIISFVMAALWAGYLHSYKDAPKSSAALFLEWFVSTVVGAFVVVAIGLG